MDKEDIINYVMDNPDNTNPAVLKDMLNQLNSGGGSGLIIPASYENNTFTLNKTFKEINDVISTGGNAVINYVDYQGVISNYTVIGTIVDENNNIEDPVYSVKAFNIDGYGIHSFNTNNQTSYPSEYQGD